MEQVYLTLAVAGQYCALPAAAVRDVLGPQALTRIPLAPPDIAGCLNLRGRIVTAIDLRRRLGLPAGDAAAPFAIVAEQAGELYALLVDEVHEAAPVPQAAREPVPATLPAPWCDRASGLLRLPDRLAVVLDVDRLLALAA